MKKILSTIALLLCLSGCSLIHVHKMDVEQGNILTPDLVNKVHPGLSKEQVRETLGTPMLINTFNDNRVDYVYTFKPAYGEYQEKTVTLVFRNGVLKEIQSNRYSQFLR
jgi:outer membrane protein assembly factor BamE